MSKKPAPPTVRDLPEDEHETLVERLVRLAQAFTPGRGGSNHESNGQPDALDRQIRKHLQAGQDDILLEAIVQARELQPATAVALRERIEEAAGTATIRRGPEQVWQAHAFAIPLFARTRGGLDAAQAFQDPDAFDLLRDSLQQGQLESGKARVALVNHAYHPDEAGGITPSQLHEMLRESAAAMTDRKITATPAIDRSLRGWPARAFAADDEALELRFLLGFVLARPDDPFYAIPDDEAQAEAWFDARAARFRAWSEAAAPLVRRCLVSDGRDCEISFLYQDLFHGARTRGLAELALLDMMAEIDAGLQRAGLAAAAVRAVVGPAMHDGEPILRVQLHADAAGTSGAPFAVTDKAVDADADLMEEVDEACDALQTLGIATIDIAGRVDGDQPVGPARPAARD